MRRALYRLSERFDRCWLTKARITVAWSYEIRGCPGCTHDSDELLFVSIRCYGQYVLKLELKKTPRMSRHHSYLLPFEPIAPEGDQRQMTLNDFFEIYALVKREVCLLTTSK